MTLLERPSVVTFLAHDFDHRIEGVEDGRIQERGLGLTVIQMRQGRAALLKSLQQLYEERGLLKFAVGAHLRRNVRANRPATASGTRVSGE